MVRGELFQGFPSWLNVALLVKLCLNELESFFFELDLVRVTLLTQQEVLLLWLRLLAAALEDVASRLCPCGGLLGLLLWQSTFILSGRLGTSLHE